jgi:hypothetical protein
MFKSVKLRVVSCVKARPGVETSLPNPVRENVGKNGGLDTGKHLAEEGIRFFKRRIPSARSSVGSELLAGHHRPERRPRKV